jgi:hypothetical protein
VRSPDDVRRDVEVGHKILKTEPGSLKNMSEPLQHEHHEQAETLGYLAHREEYFARHRSTQFKDTPFPGMEHIKGVLDSGGYLTHGSDKPGVHPDSQASIVVPSKHLGQVLKSGKFTNAFEVGGGVGYQEPAHRQRDQEGGMDHYTEQRRKTEEELFNIPFHEDDPSKRPVYGFVRNKAMEPHDITYNMSQYGNSIVDFKDPVKLGKQATVTSTDSMDDYVDDVATPNQANTHPDNLQHLGDYTEMQWHDHPEVKDIEKVHLSGAPDSPSKLIGQQFLKAGIPVRHFWTHRETQPSLFEDSLSPFWSNPKHFDSAVHRDVTEKDYRDK